MLARSKHCKDSTTRGINGRKHESKRTLYSDGCQFDVVGIDLLGDLLGDTMKRHFRNIGVYDSRELHSDREAVFKFASDGHRDIYLHFTERWQLVYLAEQIRDLLHKDLRLAQQRRDIFK